MSAMAECKLEISPHPYHYARSTSVWCPIRNLFEGTSRFLAFSTSTFIKYREPRFGFRVSVRFVRFGFVLSSSSKELPKLFKLLLAGGTSDSAVLALTLAIVLSRRLSRLAHLANL